MESPATCGCFPCSGTRPRSTPNALSWDVDPAFCNPSPTGTRTTRLRLPLGQHAAVAYNDDLLVGARSPPGYDIPGVQEDPATMVITSQPECGFDIEGRSRGPSTDEPTT